MPPPQIRTCGDNRQCEPFGSKSASEAPGSGQLDGIEREIFTAITSDFGDGGGNLLAGSNGVEVDATGNVFVAGQFSDNVFRISTSGAIDEILDGSGGMIADPFDVAVDASGNVFVSGNSSANVVRIRGAGDPIATPIVRYAFDERSGPTRADGAGPFDTFASENGSGHLYASTASRALAALDAVDVDSASRDRAPEIASQACAVSAEWTVRPATSDRARAPPTGTRRQVDALRLPKAPLDNAPDGDGCRPRNRPASF